MDVSLHTSVVAVKGGRIKPGSKLLLDYDFQPGPMGHHDYGESLRLCVIDFRLITCQRGYGCRWR
jgi:hypothetical protein